jgi:hypothetical protein
MNPPNLTLTPSNAATVAQYAELVGIPPAEFLNRFLQEFLVNRFADPQSGEAEPFLGSFAFQSRDQAERLAEWIRQRDPSLTIDILESKAGFKVRAGYLFDGKTMQVI